MTKFASTLFLIVFGFSLAVLAENPDQKTDLGDEGNKFVATEFASYTQLHPQGQCKSSGTGTPVIITGFGLFEGVSYNISGTVVQALAGQRPAAVKISSADHGAKVYNNLITVNGRKYDACLIIADVIWDLAATIINFEAKQYKPRMILMTGRGSSTASYEAGGINYAVSKPGYDSNGNPLSDPTGHTNIPKQSWIVNSMIPGQIIAFNWNAKKLARASESTIASLGYEVVGQSGPREDNNYLCNNIGFITSYYSAGNNVTLAGDKITLYSPDYVYSPVVGFFHFPTVDFDHPDLSSYKSGIQGWGTVLLNTVDAALN